MATETEQLVVSLEARIKDFERNFQKANRTANQNWSAIERRGEQASTRLERTFGGLSSRLNSSFASFGDGFKGAFLGSLGIVGASQIIEKLGASIERLNEIGEIAGRTGFTTDMVQAFQELGREATASVENVDKSLQAFTEQSATAGSFLRKLFKENGKDFDLKNPIRNLRTFMDLVRDAGSDAEKLSLVTQVVGDRAGREMTEAFKRGGDAVDEAFNKMQRDGRVMSQAQVDEAAKIKAAYIDLAADIESLFAKVAVTIAPPMLEALNQISERTNKILRDLKAGDLIGALFGDAEDWDLIPGDQIAKLNDVAALEAQRLDLLEKINLAQAGAFPGAQIGVMEAELKRVNTQLEISKSYMTAISGKPLPGTGAVESVTARPVTKMPPSSGGSGKSKKPEISDLEREIAAIKLRSAVLNQEAAILTGLIGKENDHGFALEKARAARELLNAAEKSGITITDQLRGKIDQLAGAYAASVAGIETARQLQDSFADGQAEAKAKIDDFKAGAQNVLTGFIGDLRSGISETEALSNALANVADQLLQIALTKIFQAPGADGFIGAVIAGLGFADGGVVRGPGTGRSDSIPAKLSDGEFVVNAKATAQNRAFLEAINSGSKPPSPIAPSRALPGFASNTNVNFAPVINVAVEGGSSGDKTADHKFADNIAKTIEGTIRQIVTKELRQQMRPRGMLNM